MEAGVIGDNSLRYIDINKIGKNLVPQLLKAIPGFHAFTRELTMFFFNPKGKKHLE